MEKTKIRPYHPTDLERSHSLLVVKDTAPREIYTDPSIGGDDPGSEFDRHLEEVGPERIWVAEQDEEDPQRVGGAGGEDAGQELGQARRGGQLFTDLGRAPETAPGPGLRDQGEQQQHDVAPQSAPSGARAGGRGGQGSACGIGIGGLLHEGRAV